MKKLILSVLLFLLVASSTGCTILNDSQSSIENDDKLIIDQTSTKNTSDVLIQALETNDAELFKSVFSEQTLKLQPDIDEGIKYIFNIFEGDNLEIVYENQSSESFSDLQAKCVWSICVIKTTEKCYSLTWTEWVQQETDPSAQDVYSLIFEECEEDQRGAIHRGGGFRRHGPSGGGVFSGHFIPQQADRRPGPSRLPSPVHGETEGRQCGVRL